MAVLEINLGKIRENASNLIEALKGFDVVGVLKACSGDKKIAQAFVEGGIKTIADSQINPLKSLKSLPVKKMLLRLPFRIKTERYFDLNGIDQVLVSSKQGLESLNENVSSKQTETLLMVESGLKREGFYPQDLSEIEGLTKKAKNIDLVGAATGTACQNGTNPVKQLEGFVKSISKMGSMTIISGGNSSVLSWAIGSKLPKQINQLRVGEAILLGHETSKYKRIAANHLDAFKVGVPVVEVSGKGNRSRALLGVGVRDIGAGRLKPIEREIGKIEKLYSEHITLALDLPVSVGDFVWFKPDYYCLVALMLSGYVKKRYINQQDPRLPGI